MTTQLQQTVAEGQLYRKSDGTFWRVVQLSPCGDCVMLRCEQNDRAGNTMSLALPVAMLSRQHGWLCCSRPVTA